MTTLPALGDYAAFVWTAYAAAALILGGIAALSVLAARRARRALAAAESALPRRRP